MNQSENKYKSINKTTSIAAAKYSRESKMMDGNRCNIWEIDAFISGAEFATASLIQTIENRVKELEAIESLAYLTVMPAIKELNNLLTLIKS